MFTIYSVLGIAANLSDCQITAATRHDDAIPFPASLIAVWLRSAVSGPDGAVEMQFAGLGFGNHAVEIAARRTPEMLLLLGRDDR
jgi:hypothetical protein